MENSFNAFMGGCLIGIIVTIMFTAMALLGETTTITSSKKITPEWQLVTDGKKVDTLYIYKQK